MKTFTKVVLATFAGLIIVASSALSFARATLPRTDCEVTPANVGTLKLETMTYQEVKTALGCDGKLIERHDYGPGLVEEIYSWRGDEWPYARFSGTFYNGVLHGTEHIRIHLTAGAHTDD